MVVGAGTAWRRGFVQCDRRPRHRRSSLYYVVNVNFSMKYFSTRRCFRRQRRGQATRDRSTREAPTSARVSRERAVRRALGFVFHATCASRAGVSGATAAGGGIGWVQTWQKWTSIKWQICGYVPPQTVNYGRTLAYNLNLTNEHEVD
ncbi:hypothetical protein BHE74_00007906 [Ensete ventricosum]|nr:hypothetical protein BHE74_00007906 [Ensete ventricosum]